MAQEQKGGFYLKPGLKEVAKNMGDRPAFRKGGGFWETLKKIGNTAVRVGGELGVQALDMLQPDPGNVGGSTNSFNMGGSRAAKSESYRAKDFENEYFDESRRQVSEGKQFFTLADYLDDDGSTLFAKDARDNKGTTSFNSANKKNSPKGS